VTLARAAFASGLSSFCSPITRLKNTHCWKEEADLVEACLGVVLLDGGSWAEVWDVFQGLLRKLEPAFAMAPSDTRSGS
jgi:hypothetical protein